MGQDNQLVKQEGRSLSIKTEVKQIILHEPYRLKLLIGFAPAFPHGYEGLKLWDANIVLARYVIINCNKFKNMSVLQLSSGTGITGITVQKWTSAKKIVMTDITEQVVGNIRTNCTRNKTDFSSKSVDKNRKIVFKMSWNQFNSFNAKYDIILANDPFTHHCTPQVLFKLAEHFLFDNGMMIISANNSDKLQGFIKIAQQFKYQVKRQKINNEEYMKSPLLNQVEGQKQFPQVCKGQILIYELTRKVPESIKIPQTQQNQQQLQKIQMNTKKSKKQSNEKSENAEKEKQQMISAQGKQENKQQNHKKQHIQQTTTKAIEPSEHNQVELTQSKESKHQQIISQSIHCDEEKITTYQQTNNKLQNMQQAEQKIQQQNKKNEDKKVNSSLQQQAKQIKSQLKQQQHPSQLQKEKQHKNEQKQPEIQPLPLSQKQVVQENKNEEPQTNCINSSKQSTSKE